MFKLETIIIRGRYIGCDYKLTLTRVPSILKKWFIRINVERLNEMGVTDIYVENEEKKEEVKEIKEVYSNFYRSWGSSKGA